MHVYNLAGRKAGDSQVYLLAIASSIILYRDLEHLRSQVAWRAHQVCSSTTPHSTSHITVSTSHITVTQYTSHCHTAHITLSHSTDHTVTQHMSHITLSHSACHTVTQHTSHCHAVHTLTQSTHDYLSRSPHHSV